jgi:hypothetical protein
MKTTFALLLGLLLLESCATVNKPIQTLTTPGLPAVCNATDGIYVILIDYTGTPFELVCPDIRGKPITKKLKADPGLTPIGSPVPLGDVVKLKANADPDPCIQWYVGGYLQYYCWK